MKSEKQLCALIENRDKLDEAIKEVFKPKTTKQAQHFRWYFRTILEWVVK